MNLLLLAGLAIAGGAVAYMLMSGGGPREDRRHDVTDGGASESTHTRHDSDRDDPHDSHDSADSSGDGGSDSGGDAGGGDGGGGGD